MIKREKLEQQKLVVSQQLVDIEETAKQLKVKTIQFLLSTLWGVTKIKINLNRI